MGVQGEVGRRVADLVLRVLRIMAAEEGPGPLAALAVDVLDPWCAGLVRQHRYAGLEGVPGETGGESVEIGNHLAVILDQHGGHRIDLRAEVEERERAQRLPPLDRVDLMPVDVGVYRHRGAEL